VSPPTARPLLLAGLLALLLLPAGARAAFFPGDPVDGPSADLVRIGGVDLARHGSGALVYVKRDGGVEHVFVARNVSGVWQPPERLDPSLPLPSSDPVVASSDMLTVAAFVNGTQLYVVSRRPADPAWSGPVAIANNAAAPSIDVSVNGVGYLTWTSNGDVRAATLARTATTWQTLDAPLDAAPAADAGSGLGRSDVAASADGTALATWGEAGHVYARRLFHTTPSSIVATLDVPTLAGHAGGAADSPRVDIGDDSSFAWVVFREAFDGGASTHVLARELIGSAFDPPFDIGPGFAGEGADSPALDVAGEGYAVFASDTTGSHTPWGTTFYPDTLAAPAGLGAAAGAPSQPQVAIGDSAQTTFAWLAPATPGGPLSIHARGLKRNEPSDPEAILTDPALGAVDPTAGWFASADHAGDTVIAYLQGTDAGRRLMSAGWDHTPGYVAQRTTQHWRRPLPLSWNRVSDLWGPITYTVYVDTRAIGSTTANRLAIAGLVSDGRHHWRVVATDGHGQRRSSHTRSMLIDSHAPSLRVSVPRHLPARTLVLLRARAADHGSGVAHVRFRFDDGGVAVGTRVHHAFAPGTHVVTVTATDAAGNARMVRRTVRAR